MGACNFGLACLVNFENFSIENAMGTIHRPPRSDFSNIINETIINAAILRNQSATACVRQPQMSSIIPSMYFSGFYQPWDLDDLL